MSRLVGVCAVLLVSVGSAAAADPSASTPSGADAVSTPPVKEVTVTVDRNVTVCRRQAPTGSRIAIERCPTTASSAEREQLRRDLDEMRTRAALREQARAAAQLEALRRA